ncbi:dCTP deaminase domain-containing protein [Streptomyces netropsis]|uniref:dCTP deaminase n=1 Tax=Streptomyces netropsis TaxID=55404 RepID=UPI0037B2549E
MILTGPEITSASQDGRLRIDPFSSSQVNPNSYNVRLGPTLLTYTDEVLDSHRHNPTRRIQVGKDGYALQPGELYLGHTMEEVGSDCFVPLLFGRSSVGRLGLFVEITAPIGDIGFHGLMLTPTRPVHVYAGMKIGQIMFFVSDGAIDLYSGKYQASAGPQPSAYWRDLDASAVTS